MIFVDRRNPRAEDLPAVSKSDGHGDPFDYLRDCACVRAMLRVCQAGPLW